MGGRGLAPLRLPAGFWSRADVLGALSGRDFCEVFRLVAKYGGASQTQIAIAVGMTQGQVSTIMAGDRRVTAFDVVERALDGLAVPDGARVAFGLAPRAPIVRPAVLRGPRSSDTGSGGVWEPATEDNVDRRDVLRAGVALLGVAAGPDGPTSAQLVDVARALTPYHHTNAAMWTEYTEASVRRLRSGVTRVKRDYQACRYAATLNGLPALLAGVDAGAASAVGDDLLSVLRLAADAYQVAGSVMLKFGDMGLAAIAADRSMAAAIRSQDPVVLAASARIVTHSLMQGGHASRAKEVASQAAERLADDMRSPTPDAVSVYGALLLRGAVAAAIDENRAESLRLLDEADEAATRLGRDDNAHWTAFGPTNVAQHRAHIALVLGDAGTAIDLARRIDLDRIPIAERKAALFIDTAGAFVQWGKYERAYHALRTAETIAPEEVRTRSSVRRLVGDLARRSPLTIRQRTREFAEQLGVDV